MKFITTDHIEVPAVTMQQMIEIDRVAMNETGPNLDQMMENAGHTLCHFAIHKLGRDWNHSSILVLAGTGGNGGGGICAARHLANRGAKVTVCIPGSLSLKEATAYQLHILKSTQAKVIYPGDLQSENPILIIDAIIGYSLKGEPSGEVLEMIKWASNKQSYIISLDIPSGIDATSGKRALNYIIPNATLSLALPKTGLLPDVCGELFLVDIGIPPEVYKQQHISYISPFGSDFMIKIKAVK